jgi:hypothetical protein
VCELYSNWCKEKYFVLVREVRCLYRQIFNNDFNIIFHSGRSVADDNMTEGQNHIQKDEHEMHSKRTEI